MDPLILLPLAPGAGTGVGWALGFCGALALVAAATLTVRSRRRPAPGANRHLLEANQALRAEIASRLIAETELKRRAVELQRSRDKARAASQAKSEFLANMSHELRTPLNAVMGLSEALLSTELTGFQRDHLHTVVDSAQQLVHVVEDILDFSKIDAGKLRVEREPFDLEDVIGKTLRLFEARATRKGLALTARVDDDVPRELLGDPVRLRQVITNLVANAITYTARGHVHVRVELESTEPLRLRFSVEDTGVGIHPAAITRIFEAFEQADMSSTRRHGGTGLGLSICRGLVELMGGKLDVTSVPNEGSCFGFTLRFEPAAATAAPATSSRSTRSLADAPSAETDGSPRLRVLLVEDSVPNQMVATAMLRSAGHTVEIANDGREALDLYRCNDFDVALMDVQMPVMNGLECTAAIRAIEGRSGGHLPIVALTAHASSDDREQCAASGMDDYISKPVRRAVLLETVAHAASGSGARVDWEALAARAGGHPSLLRELVETQLDELLDPLHRMLAALAEGEHDELRLHVRSLATTLESLGAARCAQIARRIERCEPDGEAVAVEGDLAQLECTAKLLAEELTAFLDSEAA